MDASDETAGIQVYNWALLQVSPLTLSFDHTDVLQSFLYFETHDRYMLLVGPPFL